MTEFNTKTIVRTKVYEIRESHKGGSWTYCMFFSKEQAIRNANRLNEEKKGTGTKFKVLEHTTADALIYNEANV